MKHLDMKSLKSVLPILLVIAIFPKLAPASENVDLLPPYKGWHGKSENFLRKKDDQWQTPFERMKFLDTPDYDQSIAFIKKLVQKSAQLEMIAIGKSPQGRTIWMVVASSEGAQNPTEIIAAGKPTLLVQAGIHSGEIDGKDAGMMLLRDIALGKYPDLLNRVNWLFIPILSVDAHEQRGLFNRVNQRGPEHMGWRTNALNLNLNRDYTKLETPELQAVIKVINRWHPTMYFDVHVTDGEDYQYDMTYGYANSFADSPNISQWFEKNFRPRMDQSLKKMGHLGGPLVFGVDPNDFKKGISGWNATPRFSNGYGDVRHLPTILWENHSLKPYKQRVLGTYVVLKKSLQILSEKYQSLYKAIAKDGSLRNKTQVVTWKTNTANPEHMDFAGIKYNKGIDPETGIHFVKWTGVPKLYKNLSIYWMNLPQTTVKIPDSYWVPVQYQEVISKLRLHGVRIKQYQQPVQIKGIELIATNHQFQKEPFENRTMVSASFKQYTVESTLPAGSYEITTDQPLRNLVVALLDPRAPDSLFAWGYFNSMFQRTEYIEPYALVPLAKNIFKQHPQLKKAFTKKIATDYKFAKDDKMKMQWIYQHSKYYDKKYLHYPIIFSE